jgi:hypothetical protein
VLPISNGMLGAVEGGLSALVFIATYATLRIAGVSRLLAGAALAVAVTVLVYGLQLPVGGLLQHGAMRFGLPAGVVLGAVAESRWPGATRAARGIQLLTIAVASIWALEAFAYTVLTAAALLALDGAAAPAGARRRTVVRRARPLLVAIGVAHLALAVATKAATGELPDWGWYANTLRGFFLGSVGDFTYDFSSFSPGYLVGALYLVSASAIVLIVARRPDVLRAERTILVGITGWTAYGVGLFSYLVNRSTDLVLPYVPLPALALLVLWLDLLRRPALDVPAPRRRLALGATLALSSLLVAAAWPSVQRHAPESAVAHVVPGGPSLSGAMDRLRNPPPVRPEAPTGELLLDAHLPGEDRSIVLTKADLSVEILLRAERGNRVPLGDPWEDSFVPDHHLDALTEFVDGLAVGDRALLDGAARTLFEDHRDDPTRDPLAGADNETGVASLQRWVLREIGVRFDLQPVARSDDDLEVVELVPLRP